MAIQWSSWATLGKPPDTDLRRPFASYNHDRRMKVFATVRDAIFNIWQVAPNGGWADGWREKASAQGNVSQLAHVVGRNADGRQKIFALGDNSILFQKWQVAAKAGWSDWAAWIARPPAFVRLTG